MSLFRAVPSSLYLSPTDLWSSGAVLAADPLASGKVLWKVPSTFLYIWFLVPRALLYICLLIFSGVPNRGFLGSMEGSSHVFCTFVSQSFWVFWGCSSAAPSSSLAFRTGSVEGFSNICLAVSRGCLEQMAVASEKVLLFQKGSLEGSPICPLHLSPSELSTPLPLHYSENDQSCGRCWGILWAYFFLGQHFMKSKWRNVSLFIFIPIHCD